MRTDVLCGAAVLVTVGLSFPLLAEPTRPAPLPTGPPVIPLPTATQALGGPVSNVYAGGTNRPLFKIAVAPVLGGSDVSQVVTETVARDFALSGMYRMLDLHAFTTVNLRDEGIGIAPAAWKGADGVVKGQSSVRGTQIHLELRLYDPSRGAEPVLRREYDTPPALVRSAVHQFDNEMTRVLTGVAGTFGTRLVFSATTGEGQKGIFEIESDGQNLARLPVASNLALAPAAGPGGIYYAGALADGGYALFRVGNPAAVLRQAGAVFGAAFGAGKMALVVAEHGRSDIYVGGSDGSHLTKITSGGLNTHPAFGPSGQLAYVSNQGGNPQIYVDGKRVTWRGPYNMAPTWCSDPAGTRLLFMGRDGATWDIFSIDMTTGRPDAGGASQTMRRLTQDQGSNTYPACSPDGRIVAFFSTRGGLYTSNTQGMNQQRVAGVSGESLRWEGN